MMMTRPVGPPASPSAQVVQGRLAGSVPGVEPHKPDEHLPWDSARLH